MEIRPLRGYRYAGSEARDISAVVAPPYDQISPEMQDRLYTMSRYNIVRVSHPKDATDKYRDARDVLNGWLADGVWSRDERPAIYPYHQTYTADGHLVTRMGFVALGEVSHYERGVVLPHERTHAGPKRDRMQLLEAPEDARRVVHHLTVEVDDRHEWLAADLLDEGAVGVVDPDGLGLEALVGEGQGHPFDVG